MANIDTSVGELPQASIFGKESLLLVENQGIAERVSGAQIKEFLRGGGGLVVVYDTGGETANYSAEEIKEFFRNGNEVVFEQPDGKGSLVYYLQFINPGAVVFETYLGQTETDEIWRQVYVQSDKSILYGEIRDPIIRKTSQLENDTLVSYKPQTLTEPQQQQARDNIGVENVLESVGGDTLTWDGNTDGLTAWDGSALGAPLMYWRVSDAAPTVEQISSGTLKISNGIVVSGSTLVSADMGDVIWGVDGIFISVVKDNPVAEGIEFPEKGFYCLAGVDRLSSLTIPGYTGFAKKQIKEKYIPDSVPQVQTAAVGQTIVVSEVDAEGKPTKWEARDAGAGWGGEEWEPIVDYTVPETTNSLTIDKDLDGNPFELKRWLVLTIWTPVAGVAINHAIQVGFSKNSAWGHCLYASYGAPNETETAAVSLALCGVAAGNQILEHYEQAQNRTSVAYQLRVTHPEPTGRAVTPQGEFASAGFKGNATCIKLCGYQTGFLHAGSIIKMWGVRA